LIGVYGGEGAELEAVDESKDGGAAGGDVVVGEEYVEVAEGVVDALGGLEALVAGEEGGFEVECVGFVELLGVGEAERSARGHYSELATEAGGPAALAAVRVAGGNGVSGLRFGVFERGHFFLQVGERVYPTPRMFFVRVANKGVRLDAASRASRTERRLTVERGKKEHGIGKG